ncbi:MAG: hypothetical protein EHM41_00080 [Chloroflexi bacterium]|nr:MAG: hypothetical protein EHM41_00080 [Chloroflexota bacterium]
MILINGYRWISGYLYSPRVVFREKFTGDGADTTFQLSGEANGSLNASFLLGDWAAARVLITSTASVTNTSGSPTYDSIIPLLRNRVGVASINSSGLVTLDYAPRNGVEFYIWYWYELNNRDVLEDYEQSDFTSSMESGQEASSVLALLDTNSSNTLEVYWNEDDTADRTLGIKVVGANRSLTIEGDTIVNQDLSSDASPTFGGVTIQGAEGADGIINLYADEGDNNEDKWRFVASAADKKFSIESYESGAWKSELLLNNADTRILIGEGAGSALTTGTGNVMIGASAGLNATEALSSTIVGSSAGRSLTTGDRNTLIGNAAGYHNQTGNYNTALGFHALYGVMGNSHTANVAIGNESMRDITTGAYNTAVGYTSMLSITEGRENTAVGYLALNNITTGDWNVALGTRAGSVVNGLIDNTTGANSIFIGYQTQPYADGDTNEIVIGHMAEGYGSNTATWGNTSITNNFFSQAATITGTEAGDAVLSLIADEGDNDADKWRLTTLAAGGFEIQYYGSGSWVSGFALNSDLYAAYTIRHGIYSDSTTHTLTSTSVPWAMTFDTVEHETGVTKGKTGTVTIDIATPVVVHWAGHGLYVDSPVVFTTDGALPTGITPGTKYYIISAGFGTDSFEISATPQGAAVNTSGSQSGTHTGTNSSIITLSAVGCYGFIFSTLCDCTSGNGTTIDIWFRKNGVNVDRSNTRVQIATASNVVVSVADIALDLAAGDKIEMFWVGSSTNDQLLAIAAQASPTRPATPSTILTVKKISK